MPTRIELLKQAGFSDDEIGDWASAERLRMQGAGFTDSEIDDEFGVTRPPSEVPPPFIERLKQGNWLYRTLGTAGEYAQRYFGDEPLGFSPENKEALSKLGLVGDIIIPTAKPIDALLRSVPAGIAGLGAGLGQIFEEGHDAALGPGPYAKGKAARDFAQLAQIAALLSGAKGPKTGSIRTQVPNITNGPVVALPRAEDFRNAAASISGTAASFPIEQKLLRLWTEHGIHPNEVANDALRDRTIAETIRSDSDKLPEAYVGDNRTTTSTSTQANAPAQIVQPSQLEESHLPAEPPVSTKKASLQQAQRDAAAATVPADGRTAPMDAEDGSVPNLRTAATITASPSSIWPAEDGAVSSKPDSVNIATVLSAPESARMIAASRDIDLYELPRKRQRPFTRDYRNQPRTDAQGRLLEDIEGRPLGADFIVGRQFAGKDDRPISPADIETALQRLNIRFAALSQRAFPKNVMGYFSPSDSKRKKRVGDIFVSSDVSLSDQDMVTAHEFGHAIDHLAGNLAKNLTRTEIGELRYVYSTSRSGSENHPFRRQPESFRYRSSQVNGELLAEGLRAYMANPNYFKTVAPKTAARIRAAVNDNPRLKKIIQFNSLGAAGLIGTGVRNQDEGDQ
ncbi:MAG TPA: hypothetical protein VNO18_16355 [Xanthobacteraceae bacterium]|jgi:hypothetical protein|nr:hypothetical protein [Xanthobacteraceae bacterium]